MSQSFSILHEDSACLVVSKPAGLLTQAPLGIDSLEVQV
jgi:23S rRNA-/tRNA-specific pseudouridylate synthase